MTKWNRGPLGDVRFRVGARAVRTGLVVLGVAIVSLAPASDCRAADGRTKDTPSATPNLRVGTEEFPDDDAINLRWEQHWTLEKDGAVRRRAHRWLKLLNSRPIRRHADPRISFREGEDELIIHTAQCIRPDGTVLPVADYSFNLVAPDDVGGWPHYAAWRQMVVSFGGIEDGAVLELDYEVVTRPGVRPWIDADLRVDDDYPVIERVVSVTVPEGTALRYRVSGPSPRVAEPVRSTADGMVTVSWSFANLPGAPGEPQSPPWRQRCARLRFTTCPSAEEMVSTVLQRVEQAAKPNDAIRRFAEGAVEHEADPAERIRKIAKKLRDTFNFVDSPKTMRSFECRSAGDVLRANYGSPLESAALCGAALRALGLEVSFEVAVDKLTWSEQTPTGSAFAGVVVGAALDGERVRVHPRHGVIRNPGSWGRRWLLGLTEDGRLRASYVAARGEKAPSDVQVTGKVTIDGEGKASGELRIRLTGSFYDPDQLETTDQQEALVKDLVGRVLSDFEVTGHSIATLSDEVLRATANVASKDALKSYGTRHVLALGAGPAFLKEFPLPLGRSYRTTAVYLGGQVRENIDLAIELPEDWTAAIMPATLGPVSGVWGAVGQQAEVDGQTIVFHRSADIRTDPIAPDDFAALREAINTLRAAGSLHLVAGP